jgi:ornithine carbamoyltransferase
MDLLKVGDLSKEEILALVERATRLKDLQKKGVPQGSLLGRVLGLIFEKSSTRTRVSFETAMYQLGGNAIFISGRDSQVGRGEPIRDTARVMARYVDALVVRTFGHDVVEEYAEFSDVPVINGLTDMHHPCQVLSDVLTITERRGTLDGLKVAWIGDGNNMANSWIEAAAVLGFDLKLACPAGYLPDAAFLKRACAETEAKIEMVGTVEEAAENADVLNTDVWASMGQESESDDRMAAFEKFQINSKVLSGAKKEAMVMHCLPAHRGEEITEEVLEGPNSVVWDQAENRLHMQKAILETLLT